MNEERRRSAAPENGSSAALSGNTLAGLEDDLGLWTVDDAAAYTKLPVSWIRSAIREGRLPAVRCGRWVRIRPETLRRWIAERER